MLLHGLTIFISSLLLFLLQIITARQILPWFGGSAAVWASGWSHPLFNPRKNLRVRAFCFAKV